MLRRLLNIYTETKRRNRNAPKYSNCHSKKKLKFTDLFSKIQVQNSDWIDSDPWFKYPQQLLLMPSIYAWWQILLKSVIWGRDRVRVLSLPVYRATNLIGRTLFFWFSSRDQYNNKSSWIRPCCSFDMLDPWQASWNVPHVLLRSSLNIMMPGTKFHFHYWLLPSVPKIAER